MSKASKQVLDNKNANGLERHWTDEFFNWASTAEEMIKFRKTVAWVVAKGVSENDIREFIARGRDMAEAEQAELDAGEDM